MWLSQKIIDIYSISLDYNVASSLTKWFFEKIQKMHYAVNGYSVAEIIVNRTNHKKTNTGLTNWKNSPNGKTIALDVIVAKNYLTKDELKSSKRIVTSI